MSENVDTYDDVIVIDDQGFSPDDTLPFETDVFDERPE